MRLREHSAIQPGALDIFRADPRHLIEQEGYNVRDLTTPEAQEKLRELADSIAEIGVTDPLVVRFDGERIIVVEGHRRLMATLMAIDAGAEIKSVPIYQEPRGISPEQRDLGLIISNSGEPLTPLEKAKVVGRLDAHGWSHQEIAKKCGWKSVATVVQYLDMLALSEPVKEHVRQGHVSATTARQLAKTDLTPEQQDALLKANLEENKRIKGNKKSHRVTKTTLQRGKPKPEPKAKPDAEIKNGTEDVHTQAPAMVAAAPEPLPPVSGDGIDETPVPEERLQDIARVTAPPRWAPQIAAALTQHHATKDLLAALKPFADLCNDFDANAKADDDIVEVLFADIKNAWSAYTAATGGQEEEAA